MRAPTSRCGHNRARGAKAAMSPMAQKSPDGIERGGSAMRGFPSDGSRWRARRPMLRRSTRGARRRRWERGRAKGISPRPRKPTTVLFPSTAKTRDLGEKPWKAKLRGDANPDRIGDYPDHLGPYGAPRAEGGGRRSAGLVRMAAKTPHPPLGPITWRCVGLSLPAQRAGTGRLPVPVEV